MTVAERMSLAAEMSEDALQISVDGEMRRHPELTDRAARHAITARLWRLPLTAFTYVVHWIAALDSTTNGESRNCMSKVLVLTSLLFSVGVARVAVADEPSAPTTAAPKPISVVTFARQTGNPEYPVSSHVSLASKSLVGFEQLDEVVVPFRRARLYIEYPLDRPFERQLVARSPSGFTRRELIQRIREAYKFIYAKEAKTSKAAVVPVDKRGKLLNRNTTDGAYGVWGHDLSDLDLSDIEVFRDDDGAVTLRLGVDS